MRAHSFYTKSCADTQVHTAPLGYGGPERPEADVLRYLLNRRSVKSFADGTVPLAHYEAVKHDLATYALRVRAVLHLDDYELACIPVRVAGVPAQVEYLVSGETKRLAHRSQPELSQQLVAACQDQVIVRNAAFMVVVLVDVNKRSHYSSGYTDYVRGVLFSGLLCAQLYQAGLFADVGTTSIGGFSEKLLNKVLQQETYLPIAVQVFGVPDNTIAKYDNSTVLGVR
jgi:alkylation response protein AidB-like acyl-CoA dehydrogenase